MSGITEVLAHNILPIFLVAAVGFWLRRGMKLETRPISSLVFNGFSPCLVFVSLVNSELAVGELADLAAFALITILLMGALGVVTGRLLGLARTDTVLLLIVLMFVNGGNYGLTLNQLRYGAGGLSRAVVYYVVSTILAYTLGVFIASMGSVGWRDSLRRLARVPNVYAVVLAILVYSLEVSLPSPFMRAVEVAASGAIPAMLVVLGMNMADLSGLAALRLTLPAISLRLLVAPFVALAIAGFINLQGISRSTSIIEASMPTAVLTTILANEFDIKPPIVTSVVVLSTLLSPLTVAFFINLFGL